MSKIKIVELKDCPAGQEVANIPVTEKHPHPEPGWHACDGSTRGPGLYRAVKRSGPSPMDARETLAEDLVSYDVPEECLNDIFAEVPIECMERLQQALNEVAKHLKFYVEDDFWVRVPERAGSK